MTPLVTAIQPRPRVQSFREWRGVLFPVGIFASPTPPLGPFGFGLLELPVGQSLPVGHIEQPVGLVLASAYRVTLGVISALGAFTSAVALCSGFGLGPWASPPSQALCLALWAFSGYYVGLFRLHGVLPITDKSVVVCC